MLDNPKNFLVLSMIAMGTGFAIGTLIFCLEKLFIA
jgi:hypothetical protein